MPPLTFDQVIGLHKGIDISRAKFSTLFMSQIEEMLNAGQGADKVLHEIQIIESGNGVSKTGPAEQFKRLPLKGLWKKHYFTAQFLAKNLTNHWKLDSQKSKKLTDEISRHAANPALWHDPAALSAAIAQAVVEAPYKHKSGNCRLTGEWIVYSESQGRRHYLALAEHDEGDENIYNKILAACGHEITVPFG
ncbi:MAG: hypothetical protein HYV16_06560 [Gammaproteobacteria bacterium]|nr:hypothetical protein [Gammaproteobacteria bacterium]